jgi:hypothetical protein
MSWNPCSGESLLGHLNPNLIKKDITEAQMEGHPPKYLTCTLQNVKVMKIKESLRKHHRLGWVGWVGLVGKALVTSIGNSGPKTGSQITNRMLADEIPIKSGFWSIVLDQPWWIL